MNFWNIKHTKQRLAILQKTQAQKRHLISLIKAKSVVAEESQSYSNHNKNLNHSRSLQMSPNSPKMLEIKRNNKILVKKIVNTEKLGYDKSIQRNNCKFINISKTLSYNHNVIYHIKKDMKQREIDQQNTRIFARLIQTSSTIKRMDWVRKNVQTSKYKENINRSKYARPDYSIQACKLLKDQSPKKYNLKVLRHNISTAETRFRGLKDSSVSNIKIRA